MKVNVSIVIKNVKRILERHNYKILFIDYANSEMKIISSDKTEKILHIWEEDRRMIHFDIRNKDSEFDEVEFIIRDNSLEAMSNS